MSDLHTVVCLSLHFLFYTLIPPLLFFFFFFFNDTATTEIYTLSLHDALPICLATCGSHISRSRVQPCRSMTAAPAPSSRKRRRASSTVRYWSTGCVARFLAALVASISPKLTRNSNSEKFFALRLRSHRSEEHTSE